MTKTDSQIGESLVLVRKYRSFAAGLSTWSKPLGLSADGCLIVLLLRDAKGASNTEIAAALGLNLSTATKIIDRLVSDNLVHRKPDTDDRRRIQIFLTEDGMAVAQKAGERFAEFSLTFPLR
jgi:DNA-binding MarR family transcriptional regulator